MISLIIAYYVFAYDPEDVLLGSDYVHLHHRQKPNPIDIMILRWVRSNLGNWYKIQLRKADKVKLEKALNTVSECVALVC